MAGTLVSGDAPTTDDDFATPTAETHRITTSLYDGNAAQPASPADASRLYGYSMLTGAIECRGADLWAQTGAPESTQRRMRDDFVGIARATGLPEPLMIALADSHISHLLAEARQSEDPDAAEALDTQIAAWNAEARAAIRDTYGAKDGEQLLERTRKFARAHPALAKVLQERGIGSRPDIVQGIAAHVFSTGYR